MKYTWNIIITVLLVALIGLVLYNNKREIDLKVEFAERNVEVFPVKTISLEPKIFHKTLTFTGILKPNVELYVNAPVQGRVLSIYAKEGESVNRNSVLLKVEDEYLRAEYNIDKQNYELAQKNLSRIESLSDEGAVTGQQLEQLENQANSAQIKKGITEKRLNETWVKSPVKGNVNQLLVKEGMLVNQTVPLCEIVDISKFKISLKVTEKEISYLEKGQKVTIIPESKSDESFTGTIKNVALNADFALQYGVDIEFDNPTNWLKGGMMVTVEYMIEDDEKSFVVPKDCVISENGTSYIYVFKENKAVKKPINIRDENGELYKIDGKLVANEQVIVEGQSKLYDGVSIKVIES